MKRLFFIFLIIKLLIICMILNCSMKCEFHSQEKPDLQIGHCYYMLIDDPFDNNVYIKIVDIKDDYIQFYFLDAPNELTNLSETWFDDFKEMDCNE